MPGGAGRVANRMNLPPRSRPLRPILALAGAALVIAACGSPASTDDRASDIDSSQAAAGAAAAADVVPAPLVGASTIEGAAFDADGLAGRPTVAWFWAPWCIVCRGEAPDVVAVVEQYRDQVNFVGIAGRGDTDEMRDFVADTGTGIDGFVHLDDGSGEIWAAYEIYAQPAFAFITADGRVETFTGSLGAGDLSAVIEQMLAA
jgi:thiol-disulfide isomerase/thioredoxin